MEDKKIQTIIECPKCQTKFDIKAIKERIKQRIDAEMDAILDKL